MANGDEWHLPDQIVSSEYLTLEGKKISTSNNWAIWLKDILYRYNPDSLRYFIISNGPERRDSDFSWREYYSNHNNELLGAYGNFINRNLAFVEKYFGGVVPNGSINKEIEEKIISTFTSVGENIEKANLRDALEEIFELVRFGNRYFDAYKPWITRDTNINACENTIFNCVQLVANLATLLLPFLPFSSEKVCTWLALEQEWEPQFVRSGYIIPTREILFERLDKKIIDEEFCRLVKKD